MSIDPHFEDYQRLSVRFARDLDPRDPFGAARAAADFARRYRSNRDSLPQTDADRAFHLVVKASDLIDYQLPFATDDSAAQKIILEARKCLNEALDLDPSCHDARRMLAAASSGSPTAYHRYLADNAAGVREACERDAASYELPEGDLKDVATLLAFRPYLRWIAIEASNALVCGRYRLGIRLANEALELDPSDPVGVRLTLAIAYAKLEDEETFASLYADARKAAGNGPLPGAAWYSLARMALAFKREDRDAAEEEIRAIITAYPNAGTTLTRQDDLPDGIFCRICVAPGSEDELILATSEATVLLQEGFDANERGTLGSWVSSRPDVAEAYAREVAIDPTLKEGQS